MDAQSNQLASCVIAQILNNALGHVHLAICGSGYLATCPNGKKPDCTALNEELA
jgi:hypothetical protein